MRTSIFRPTRLFPLALAVALSAAPASLAAQAASPDAAETGPLYEELARLDSLLFDAAFVTCDAAKSIAMFTDDIEFYHDVTGMAVGQQVRDQFTSLTQACPRKDGVRRVLVPGTLRAYPMNHYGAVQTGTHRFTHENGEPTGIAMFVHLWRQVDGEWKLARVVSFDHRVDTSAAKVERED